MRKLVTMVIALSVIPLVEALTLFGQEASMLVIIPLILILILVVVFVFMIIRDKIKSKSAGTNLELDSILEPPEENLGELPEVTKLLPKTQQLMQKTGTDYKKEISIIEKELNSKDKQEIHKKLNRLIRKFFSDYLQLGYSFTFEELEKELNKRNKEIICFSDNLSLINYSPEGISEEKLTELIQEFKDVVISTKENQPLPPKFKKEVKDKKKKIDALLKKGKKLIGKDLNQAIENYTEISKLYNTLPDKDKEVSRPSIIDFYSKLRL